MARKILSVLMDNLPFKILAVGLAFILWLVVYNIDDPNVTQTFTTKVTIENAATIAEGNKCYQVVDNTNIVTFPVTAKRSVLKNLDNSDFRAVADMNQMILSDGGTSGSVPIEISSGRLNSSLSYPSRNFLKVSLENMMSKRFTIGPATTGDVAEGYALGEVTVVNPTMIKVSGPESIVSTIEKVVATIDVEGLTTTLSDNIIPRFYDGNNNEINSSRLTLSNTTVTVSARILVTKELPLNFSFTGTPESGYKVVGVTSTPSMVWVKGSASAINPLTDITIPAGLIDVNGARADINTMIDITELLPDGVSLVNAPDGRVAATVLIEQIKSMRYTLRSEQITVEGAEEGFEARLANAYIGVTVNGLQRDLDLLSARSITGSVDVSGFTEGTHQLPVRIELDHELYSYQEVLVTVIIKPLAEENSEGNSETDSQGENNTSGNTDDSEA